ncbi:redoxin domain-containing protein [Leptobacterium flavescens]|uniref:Redoxin domain-containing protein n=1 Tax=Leptobacterium flavescens TaxID=472055 RepID=A0A6P0UK93_9FLAO|nr:SCO family protein [Leptobacterium flavescens]NER13387.1 redoxin domain-containing protein [Leptobacterium flavescens]
MSFYHLKRPVLLGGLFILLITGILLSLYLNASPTEDLPVYNPTDLDPSLVDASLLDKNKNHTVADFKLVNQNGETITQEDYKDKIYIADFIFTRCLSICPVMTNNMAQLQEEFKTEQDIAFLSMSVTPEIDSVSVLRAYADRHGAIDRKWNITTGNKKHIYSLARKSYFAALDEGDGGLQDFIHTTNFVLIDKKKQIRGIYNGTDDTEIQRLIRDIRVLQN